VKVKLSTSARTLLLGAALFLLATPAGLSALSVNPPPALPAPSGTVVNVSTESQLQAAVSALKSNTTIVIAPGTYTLSSTLYVNGTFTNVGIRGATNNRDDVVLVGKGMANSSYGNVPYGIWVGGSVSGITIANLTVKEVWFHPIILNAGTQSPLIHNVHLINAGQQFLKANPDDAGGGVNNGIVEYSVFEYTTTSKDDYTNGVDVHTGNGWTVRHNLFRNIKAPSGLLAGPAVLMWNGTTNSIVEGNTFIDCQREISLGLNDKSPYDHSGGVARNNFIYRSPGLGGDAAILIGDSPNTQVVNNTIFVNGGYPSPIEYRFGGTTNALIANNLLDGKVLARDGATGTASGNYTSVTAGLFVNPTAGDLHLKSTAAVAIDKATGSGTPAQDWDNEARPYGSAADIGADEYRPTSTTAAPAPPTNVRVIK